MVAVIVGSSGHYEYAFHGLIKHRIPIVGISSGSNGFANENFLPMKQKVTSMGFKSNIYDNYIQMFDEMKPDIAIINAFFYENSDIAIEALNRGINVFIEKPIATDLVKLKKLEEAFRKASDIKKIYLSTMFGIRYTPHFVTLKALIKVNAIGNIRMINSQKSYKIGQRPEFYRKRETYGGIIPWISIHAIDWINWLSDEKFLSVSAQHSCKDNLNNGEMEMIAFCMFKMTNEIIATVSADMLRPKNAKTHDDDRIKVIGTNGIIEIMNNKVYMTGGGVPSDIGTQEIPLLASGDIFVDFLEQVIGDRTSDLNAENAFYITRIALNARESADTGKSIEFDII